MNALDPEIREHLYIWLDSIPFSRPRKKLRRYFSDASMVAELINYFNPNFVLENAYPACMSMASKIDNWERLNIKVLRKLGIKLSKNQIKDLAGAKLEATETFLCQLAAVIYRRNYGMIKRVLNGDVDRKPQDGYDEYAPVECCGCCVHHTYVYGCY